LESYVSLFLSDKDGPITLTYESPITFTCHVFKKIIVSFREAEFFMIIINNGYRKNGDALHLSSKIT